MIKEMSEEKRKLNRKFHNLSNSSVDSIGSGKMPQEFLEKRFRESNKIDRFKL